MESFLAMNFRSFRSVSAEFWASLGQHNKSLQWASTPTGSKFAKPQGRVERRGVFDVRIPDLALIRVDRGVTLSSRWIPRQLLWGDENDIDRLHPIVSGTSIYK